MSEYKKSVFDHWLADPVVAVDALHEKFAPMIVKHLGVATLLRVRDPDHACSEAKRLATSSEIFPLIKLPYTDTAVDFGSSGVLLHDEFEDDGETPRIAWVYFHPVVFEGKNRVAPMLMGVLRPDEDFNVKLGRTQLTEYYLLHKQEQVDNDHLEQIALQEVAASMYAISVMNCHNVEKELHDPPPSLSAWHKDRHGRPLLRYYTLKLSASKSPRRATAGHTGEGKAMHFCRGHFRDYRQSEKGLFGKYKVLVWTPPMLKGAVEHGIVAKDYEL